eukprot:TRINITY_DN2080_c0_g1_i2.p1 TRINITY_DN2080_c0_g1~~TRINITY_DN2080_c0_g1_i2.p1  ORF type:complete len:325 (+),score=80.44 TRINITY_DN2080_c0_g1_i2:33-977(+)
MGVENIDETDLRMASNFDPRTTIQCVVSGGIHVILLAVNGTQLIANFVAKRSVGFLPTSCHAVEVYICLFVIIGDFMRAHPSSASFSVYSAVMTCHMLVAAGSVLIGGIWVYETTRNAYLGMYLHSKVLPRWPFIASVIVCIIGLIFSLILCIVTNHNSYNSLFLFSLAIFKLVMCSATFYFAFKLRASMQATSGNGSNNTANSLDSFWLFIKILTAGSLILMIAEVVQGLNDARADDPFYDEKVVRDFTFNVFMIPVIILNTFLSIWAWRSLPCMKPYAQVSQISSPTHAANQSEPSRAQSKPAESRRIDVKP